MYAANIVKSFLLLKVTVHISGLCPLPPEVIINQVSDVEPLNIIYNVKVVHLIIPLKSNCSGYFFCKHCSFYFSVSQHCPQTVLQYVKYGSIRVL